MTETFRCRRCGGVFIKERSDGEAMEEAKAEWGDTLGNNPVVVCHDCYESLMKVYGERFNEI